MKKRLLALLLCLVMVIGLVPVALAETGASGEGAATKRTVNFYKDGTIVNTIEVDVESTFTQEQNNAAVTALGTKEGYTFAGWAQNPDGSNLFSVGATWPAGSGGPKGLYATWTAKTYTITFHANNGTDNTETQTFTVEDPRVLPYGGAKYIALRKNTFDGTFEGWSKTADGKVAYIDEKAVKLSELFGDGTTADLYAVWSDNQPTPAETENFSITYYDAAAGGYRDVQIKKNTEITINPDNGEAYYCTRTDREIKTSTKLAVTESATLTTATAAGKTSLGWKYDAATKTFTAVWDNNYYYNTYSIYYYDYDDCKSEYANFPYGTSVVIDPNGGTAKLSGTSFSTKQSFNIYRDYTLTDASRSGYTFYGWDLTKSGSTYYFTAMWSRYKSDVPYMLNGTDHYAYIKGYPNGSFKPTDTITRAEAATIFYRLLTDSTRKAYATTYNSFKDVPATAWYNTAVSTMAKLGIVNGGADGYFRPNDPITRAEIAAMIARCDGAYYTGTSTVFSDTYGHWAASYIARAYELGWINGYGTTYAPDRYISRAETVAVLNRVLNRAPQYTSDLTRNYTTFSDVATSAWYYLDVEEAANSHTYTRKSNADYETWTKLIADPSWF